MEKSEMMKKFEAETGESLEEAKERWKTFAFYSRYIAWLEAQLTWRPVSEGLPEIGQRVLYLGNDVDIGEYNGYGEWIDTDGGILPIQCTTHWLPIPPAPERNSMTREHRAWEMLIRRLNYLNTFGGNRSEMEKTTRIVAEIWDDTGHEDESLDKDR